MHELIIKYFNKDLTDAEKDELFSRMETDEALRNEFETFQNLSALTVLLPREKDTAYGRQKLAEFKRKRLKHSSPVNFPYKHVAGYAATACLAVFFTWWALHFQKTAVLSENEALAYEEFSTPSGQRAKLKLHDGTVVWLNARSTLRYPNRFVAGERRVELDGEAFFEVESAKQVPFVVSTEKVDIKVMGTKFNVFAYKGRNEFNTSLMEGAVKIYESAKEEEALYIEPHECVEWIDNRLVKRSFGNEDFLLWREGIYSFDDVAFIEIIRKLELYYDIGIVVKSENIGKYRFSGKFRQRDGVESVLRTLQKVKYFSFIKDDERNEIIIR